MESEVQSNENQGNTEGVMASLMNRLADAVERLERAISVADVAAAATSSGAVGTIVAMVEAGSRDADMAQRLADVDQRLAGAEKTIADLRAQSSAQLSAQSNAREGRRTLPVSLLAKQDGSVPEPGALDAALVSLSLEQRIAVKAQLLRAGIV